MNKRELVGLHKRLCKELGIPPCEVVFSKRNTEDETGFSWADYNPWTPKITVFERSFKNFGGCPRESIAHETYHHYQRIKGWLMPRGTIGTSWKGESTEKWLSTSYSKKPWEAGAFRYQRKISKREGWA